MFTDVPILLFRLRPIAASPYPAEDGELYHVQNQIIAHHGRLKASWQQVWEERKQESEAHAAALAAAQAHTAAPGSKADLEHVAGLWGLLAGAALVVFERAREAMPEGTRALAGDAAALRDAVAPIDAGLPPAGSGRD